MIRIDDIKQISFDAIPIDSFWNEGEESELKMHRIHAYPAKFPAFITTKAIEFASKNGIKPNCIADIFCGCGTVALEAKRNNIDFWGCDINPIATMIAKAKSRRLKTSRLVTYHQMILKNYAHQSAQNSYNHANERLKYWYFEKQYQDLYRLKKAIDECISEKSIYRDFFLCAFSNILKPTSRWLTKSIKPQLDPAKKPNDVLKAFNDQFGFMLTANNETSTSGHSSATFVTGNFLDPSLNKPKVDMIITSPPYVTSYEYADLHQLSSMWLGYADDYRTLREGSIGSLFHVYNFERELKRLNDSGSDIVFRLLTQDKSKARSVAKYFLDMQNVANDCFSMLSDNGIALFVIGNTEYKGVRIDNAKHLVNSLQNCGFKKIFVTKRKISKKILTPYRDKKGRFTTNCSGRKVYSEEYIIVGRK